MKCTYTKDDINEIFELRGSFCNRMRSMCNFVYAQLGVDMCPLKKYFKWKNIVTYHTNIMIIHIWLVLIKIITKQ